MKRFLLVLAVLLIAAALVWAAGDEQTHNVVPSATSSFLTDLQAFLKQEDAKRYTDMFVPMVVSGGTHGTAAGLTATPATLTAYPGGYYTTETASVTYPNASTCWLIVHKNRTGNVGTFNRVAATHYLTDCASPTQPALPANAAYLMKVVTAGGAITSTTDLRNLSAAGNPLIPPGGVELGRASIRTGTLDFYHASSALRTRLQAGNATGAVTYIWPVAAPAGDGYLLASTTAGAWSWVAPASLVTSTSPVRFLLQGNAAVGTKQVQVLVERAAVITKVWLYADAAPVGADLIIDLNLNGTTLWTTQANRARVVAGANAGAATVFNTTAVAAGDRLSLDVDQVGSTTVGGNDLLVTIQFQ